MIKGLAGIRTQVARRVLTSAREGLAQVMENSGEYIQPRVLTNYTTGPSASTMT